ncbi:hypothetical protein [Synechococcus sp. PCC 7336]|nr:hypothetical protein [Synechococcus sp. PCC 7336]
MRGALDWKGERSRYAQAGASSADRPIHRNSTADRLPPRLL